jgi:hypothetical protein
MTALHSCVPSDLVAAYNRSHYRADTDGLCPASRCGTPRRAACCGTTSAAARPSKQSTSSNRQSAGTSWPLWTVEGTIHVTRGTRRGISLMCGTWGRRRPFPGGVCGPHTSMAEAGACVLVGWQFATVGCAEENVGLPLTGSPPLFREDDWVVASSPGWAFNQLVEARRQQKRKAGQAELGTRDPMS